jgi:hypothetical protein
MRVVAVALMAALAVPASVAFAQYPQPVGACSIVQGSGDVAAGQEATFVVTTLTANGQPAPNVSGTVSIASGNGTVLTPTFTTDATGKATVRVRAGDPPGQLSLSVTCGALQTSTIVRTTAGVVIPKPPVTGLGTQDSDVPWALIAVGIVAVAAASAGGVAVAKRRA